MISIPNPIASAAQSRPCHITLADDTQTMTASALLAAVQRKAGFLSDSGVNTGDVVALAGEATVDWVVCFHAVGWLGAVAAPLPHAAVSMGSALRTLSPRLIVTSCARHDVVTEARQWPHCPVVCATDGTAQTRERFWPLDERRLLVLTSGTTGAPRAVALTTAQLVFNAFGSAARLGLDVNDCWLACLPLEHVGGIAVLWRSAFYGTRVRLLARFDAARVNALIDSAEVSLVSLVPTMLERVLDQRHDQPFPASLRAILVGGAATSASLVTRCHRLGAPVALSWGMTETASQVATTYPNEPENDAGVGPPLAFARVTADVDQRLQVYGPLAEPSPWLTNDYGSIDACGRVHVNGRLDDVIVCGGKKVDPVLVENVLCQHPAIAAAAVVGVPDAQLGERPLAFVVLRVGKNAPSFNELAQICAARLPRHCIPSRFVWRHGLDTTALGKVTRAALRIEAAALAKTDARSSP